MDGPHTDDRALPTLPFTRGILVLVASHYCQPILQNVIISVEAI
mgnify:CR=1 FL=1